MTEPEQLPAPSGRLPAPTLGGADPGVPTDRERLYLALLDLAPAFTVPCRPGGALRDITVSRHRAGPEHPWQWAIHRRGSALMAFAWTGQRWDFVEDLAHMLLHAVWTDAVQAISEAQLIASADLARGHTQTDRTGH
ncbi:hypothetical protein ACIREO_22240 [Streptomyces sp. NPDC102441]|uniref:hypothetical protein n=1 Tax=Streptomyces sp. NPDC102441 TaxID=3366176 RepID=UPI00382EA63F